MTEELSRNYTEILRAELVPAMGCTEPIAIAYAAAKAAQTLGEEPEHIIITCSGNIIKNVKGVTVPNSGGQKGIGEAKRPPLFFFIHSAIHNCNGAQSNMQPVAATCPLRVSNRIYSSFFTTFINTVHGIFRNFVPSSFNDELNI